MTTPIAPDLIPPELRDELAAIAGEEACELLEIEHRSDVLRFVIDHPDGIKVEQCEAFSRQASALLDVEDFGSGRYLLEVTSPGLDRKLYNPTDYKRFAGQLSRITYRGNDGRRVTMVGELLGFDAEGATVTLRDRQSGETTAIPQPAIEKARLEIDL